MMLHGFNNFNGDPPLNYQWPTGHDHKPNDLSNCEAQNDTQVKQTHYPRLHAHQHNHQPPSGIVYGLQYSNNHPFQSEKGGQQSLWSSNVSQSAAQFNESQQKGMSASPNQYLRNRKAPIYQSPFKWQVSPQRSSGGKSPQTRQFAILPQFCAENTLDSQMCLSPRTDRLERIFNRIDEYRFTYGICPIPVDPHHDSQQFQGGEPNPQSRQGFLQAILDLINSAMTQLQNNPFAQHQQNELVQLRLYLQKSWALYEQGNCEESLNICDFILLTLSANQVQGIPQAPLAGVETLARKCANLISLAKFSEAEGVLQEIDSLQEDPSPVYQNHNITLMIGKARFEILRRSIIQSPSHVSLCLDIMLKLVGDCPDAIFSLKESALELCVDTLKNLSALYQSSLTGEGRMAIKKTGEVLYELFKLHRDSSGDIHICMNYLNQAIEIADPLDWVYLFEMSLFIKQAFRLKHDASNYMKRVLEKQPANAKVWYEAACLAEEMGEYDQAQNYLQRSLMLDPHNTLIFSKIASIMISLKRYGDGIQVLQDAINLCKEELSKNGMYPDLASMLSTLHGQMGIIYMQQDDNNMAFEYLNHAYQFDDQNVANWINMACLDLKVGRYDSCMSICDRILSVDATNEKAFEIKGDLHKNVEQLDQAYLYYKRAIEFNPDSHSANSSVADILRRNGKLQEAIDHYKKALSVRIDLADTFSKLCGAKLSCCDWEQQDECYNHLFQLVSKQMETDELPCVDPFTIFMYNFFTPEQKFLICKKNAEFRKQMTLRNILASGVDIPVFKHSKVILNQTNQSVFKIRIGYMSFDFADHPLAHLLASIFSFHDRSRFHIVGISLRKNDGSEWRQKIERGCDEFYEINENMSTVDLAQMIYSKNIHILFNLNGWTTGERTDAFVLRPSPIQISYMGFCGSIGADFIDYIVTDEISSPPDIVDKIYSEKAIYMPHSYFVSDYMQSSQYVFAQDNQRSTRAQYGLPEDKFIFANFNQLYKLDPITYTVWMNIMKRVPDSVLWLLEYPKDAKENLLKEAQARGVDPSRIIIMPKAPKHEHVERCHLADLSLDNPITNGHTTTVDLLWSGLPIITYPISENMPSRVATSLCYALECPEMVVNSYQEYEDLAVKLATTNSGEQVDEQIPPEILRRPHGSMELKLLRAKVQAKRLTAPLFNTQLWVRHLELGLLEAWKRFCNSSPNDPQRKASLSNSPSACPPSQVQNQISVSPNKFATAYYQQNLKAIVNNYDTSSPYPLDHIYVKNLC